MLSQPTSYLSPKLTEKQHRRQRGYGVFAQETVQQGELLVVWGGDIVTGEQLVQLDRLHQQRSVQVEENLYMAPTRIGPADYVNHSCDPNAGLSGQICLVALRDIRPGEEVCYDYAMSDGSPYDEFECFCQSTHCRRRITGNDWQIPELWSKYDRHFSPYLQRRIQATRAQLNLTEWSINDS